MPRSVEVSRGQEITSRDGAQGHRETEAVVPGISSLTYFVESIVCVLHYYVY